MKNAYSKTLVFSLKVFLGVILLVVFHHQANAATKFSTVAAVGSYKANFNFGLTNPDIIRYQKVDQELSKLQPYHIQPAPKAVEPKDAKKAVDTTKKLGCKPNYKPNGF